MSPQDCFRALGMESTASKEELDSAYRQKMRRVHPDVGKMPQGDAHEYTVWFTAIRDKIYARRGWK